MEIDSPEKKLPNKHLPYKRHVSFVNVDTSYGENFSTANSVTEIKPLIKKIEYKEIKETIRINDFFESIKEDEENSIVSFQNHYIDEIFENTNF